MKHIFTISLCFLALSLSVYGQDFVPSGFISIGSSDSTDFFVSEISLTWNQAKANAESLGGHLGTFATVEENNAILSELSDEAFWIGLFQPEGSEEPSGSWGWVTSEVLAFTNWSAGEPNDNGDYTENCVHAAGLPYLLWNDAQCDSQSRFILELSNIAGCTIEQACNFNPDANVYDGSCDFSSCKCLEGTVWNDELEGCVVENPTDTNLDGCTDLNDLMDILSAYGGCDVVESDFNYSLSFDGDSGDNVEINNFAGLSNDITVAGWVLFNDSTNEDCIIEKHESNWGGQFPTPTGWWLRKEQRKLRWLGNTINGQMNNESSINLPIGSYVFVAATYDGVSSKLYINGVDCSGSGQTLSNPGGSIISNSRSIVMGMGRWGAQNNDIYTTMLMDGNISEISIWNSALTQEQIQSYMSTPPTGNEEGLVGYWDFNEGAGSTLTDQTSNGNDGVINGATWSTDVPTAP